MDRIDEPVVKIKMDELILNGVKTDMKVWYISIDELKERILKETNMIMNLHTLINLESEIIGGKQNVVFMGIVSNIPSLIPRTSLRGEYFIFDVIDLMETIVRVFLYGSACDAVKSEGKGVLWVFSNPKVKPVDPQYSIRAVEIEDAVNLLKVGVVSGLQRCKGNTKHGNQCSINIYVKTMGEYCKYHIKQGKENNKKRKAQGILNLKGDGFFFQQVKMKTSNKKDNLAYKEREEIMNKDSYSGAQDKNFIISSSSLMRNIWRMDNISDNKNPLNANRNTKDLLLVENCTPSSIELHRSAEKISKNKNIPSHIASLLSVAAMKRAKIEKRSIHSENPILEIMKCDSQEVNYSKIRSNETNYEKHSVEPNKELLSNSSTPIHVDMTSERFRLLKVKLDNFRNYSAKEDIQLIIDELDKIINIDLILTNSLISKCNLINILGSLLFNEYEEIGIAALKFLRKIQRITQEKIILARD